MSRRKRYARNLGRKLKEPLPRRMTVEWVRFEHEREPYGVFSYLTDAREVLPVDRNEKLEELVDWFSEHLMVPGDTVQLDRERFWFCAEANEFIDKARTIADLVREAGIPIVERRTRRVPGKIKWQDPTQVAVIVYRDTPKP